MLLKINRLFVALVLMMTISVSFAQNYRSKIDSLAILASKTKDDSLRCGLYIELANEYNTINEQKSDFYVGQAQSLFKKIDASKLKVKLALFEAYKLIFIADYDKALAQLSQVNKALKDPLNKDLFLHAVYIESLAYTFKGDYQKAIALLEKTILENPKTTYYKELARLHFSLGQVYSFNEDLSHSISNIKKAIENYKKAKFTSGLFACYGAIGNEYMELKNYKKALHYVSICESYSKSEATFYTVCVMKGELFLYLKRYDEAIDYLKKGIAINEKIEDNLNRPNYIFLLLKCYLAKKETAEVINLCTTELQKDPNNFLVQYYAYYSLANAYYLTKKYSLANQYIDRLEVLITKKIESKVTEVDLMDFYQLNAKIKAAIKAYQKAYLFHKKYIDLFIVNDERIKNQNALQLQDELDSYIKDNRINELTLLKKESNLKIQNQQYYIIIYSIVILFMVVIIVVIVFFFRKIQIKNKVISKNAQVILEQNNTISQSLAVKELLLKEIHHRVKNNLQIVMNLLKIQARESTLTSIDEFVKKGQARILTMSLIHENLYATDHLDTIDLQKYIADLVANLKSLINWGHEEIDINIKVETIYFDIQNAVPLGLIINELLTNSFKHAFNKVEKGEINISLKQKENKAFELSYSDSGPGFELQQTDRKTLGLELIHQLTKQLNGKVHKEPDKNSKFLIIINPKF